MAEPIKLLLVDDEARFLETLSKRLTLRGFDVTATRSGREALRLAGEREFDLAVVDLKMPDLTGEEVLDVLKRDHPNTEVILLTGYGSVSSAVERSPKGSFNYLQKPCEMETLLEALRKAYQTRVERTLQLDPAKIESLLELSLGESPLGIIRRLKELEDKAKK